MPEYADLPNILRKVLRDTLEADKAQRLARGADPFYLSGSLIGDAAEHSQAPRVKLAVDAYMKAVSDEASRRTDAVRLDVGRLAAQFDVPAEQMQELALGLLHTRTRIAEVALEREVRGIGREIAQLDAQPGAAQLETAASVPKPSNDGPLLSAWIDEFIKDKRLEKISDKTLDQYEQAFKLFFQVHEDKAVGRYTRADVSEFFNILRALPSNYSRPLKWRGLSLREIVARTQDDPSLERLTMKTIERHFSALNGVFGNAVRHGYRVDNPGAGWNFDRFDAGAAERHPWPDSDLRKLAASPVWTGSQRRVRIRKGPEIIKDALYWLPILALYQGMRQNEIAQLLREDIREADGITYFDINDNHGKTLKTNAAKRRVPIHPEVSRLGFLEYAESTATENRSSLFPGLNKGGTYGAKNEYFTSQFGNYRRGIGLGEKLRDFHAFRHNFATKLAEANTGELVIKQLIGHEDASVTGGYIGMFGMSALSKAVAAVHYPGVSFDKDLAAS